MMLKENRIGRSLRLALDISVLVAPSKPNKTLELGDVVRIEMRNYTAINGLYVVNSIEVTTDFIAQLDLAGYDPEMVTGWSVALETAFTE